MYSEMKKNIEHSGAPIGSPLTFAPVSVREEKIRNGTSGCSERSSMATKVASRSDDSANRPIVCVEPQPALLASTSAYTSAERPAVTLTAPSTSKVRVSEPERDSAISRGATKAGKRPVGTLTHSTPHHPPPRRAAQWRDRAAGDAPRRAAAARHRALDPQEAVALGVLGEGDGED